jgi:hypothetical protein
MRLSNPRNDAIKVNRAALAQVRDGPEVKPSHESPYV